MINLTITTRADIYTRTWTADEIARLRVDPEAPLATLQAALEGLGYRVLTLQSYEAQGVPQALAEVTLPALPEDRLTFIMHDLAVRQQIALAIDYDELATLLGEVRQQRAALAAAGDVTTLLPVATTAEAEAAIVEVAVALADEICDADRETFVCGRTALEIAVRDRALLARTVAIMADRFDTLDATPPRDARCVWCWLAAGSTSAAWTALPRLAFDEIRDHITVCEHGPVVALRHLKDQVISQRDARIQELHRDFVRLTQEHPFPDEIKGWRDERAKLIAEIGTLKAHIAERERQASTPGGWATREAFVRAWTQRLNIRDDELEQLLCEYAQTPTKTGI